MHTSGRVTHRMSLFSCVQGPRSLSLTVELSYHISSYDTEEVVKPPIFVLLIIQFPSTVFVYKIFVGFYHKQYRKHLRRSQTKHKMQSQRSGYSWPNKNSKVSTQKNVQ